VATPPSGPTKVAESDWSAHAQPPLA
jgi:hypothetical protein